MSCPLALETESGGLETEGRYAVRHWSNGLRCTYFLWSIVVFRLAVLTNEKQTGASSWDSFDSKHLIQQI